MKMRDSNGRFIKGHPGIPNSGNFKPGQKKPENAYVFGKKENHPNWNGGRYVSGGKVFVLAPWHPGCDSKGYIMEHRLVVETSIKRLLKPEEKVHHLNKNTLDNRIENLVLTKDQSEHIRVFHKKKRDIRNRFLKEA